jgi:hypothetical protein
MTYAVTYTLSGKSYAVDPAKIPVVLQLELARLAASGTKADLAEFVTILARYPNAYKIVPTNPLNPEGPLGPLDDNLLDELGIDIAAIIAIAMLICLQVERDMRKMGLELSQQQVDQMVAKAVEEYETSMKANKAQLDSGIAGAIAGIVTGGMGIAGGGASFGTMVKGDKLSSAAKRDQKKLNEDRANLDKMRAESDKTLKKEFDDIEVKKTKLQDLENDAKKTRDEVTELRGRIISDKNDKTQCAADEAATARLQRKEDELEVAKKEEQEIAKALKDLEGTSDANGPLSDQLRFKQLLQKDEVDKLQLERDALLDATATSNPAAAAPFLQRDRDALRADITSKEQEKIEIEKTLGDLDTKKVRLVEERDGFIEQLNKPGLGKVERSEIDRQLDRVDVDMQTIAAQKKQATQELDAKDAEIAKLKVKHDDIEAKLEGFIPAVARAEVDSLVAEVDERAERVESLKAEKADLELEVLAARKDVEDLKSGPAAHLAAATAKLKEKEAALGETEWKLKGETYALQAKRIELESNDLHKLDAAESRLKEQDSELEASRFAVNKQESELVATRERQNAEYDAESKRIDDDMEAVQDKFNAVNAKTEEAAALRTGLDGIGKVLSGFLNLGEVTLKKIADDLHTEKERDGREMEILQISQGIYSSFADNVYTGLGETRGTFSTMLDNLAKTNQGIAQRM